MVNKLIIGVPIKEKDYKSFYDMLVSIKESVKDDTYDRIVIVDGGDMEKTKLVLSLIDMKFELVKNPGAGPLEAYNYLFDLAKKEGSDLFLTQTDVLFPKLYKQDWLDLMKEQSQKEIIGAVTCINGGGISGEDYYDGLEWLGGWCSYYSHKLIEKIGGYDENFPDPQYGVDIDHTYRIYKAGLKISRFNYWVHHHLKNDRQHDRHPDTKRHKEECARFFRQKWGLGEFAKIESVEKIK